MSTSFILNAPSFPEPLLNREEKGKTPMSHLINRQKAETMPIAHTDRTVFPGVVYVSVHAKDKINLKDS